MGGTLFQTTDGQSVTAVTAEEMRAVDRVAVENVGIDLLQMMENAGRNLAGNVTEEVTATRDSADEVVIVAGNGGNGGGGLACARHLRNHNVSVSVVLDRLPDTLDGAAAQQYAILDQMGVPVGVGTDAIPDSDCLIVDALVGYGLSGPLGGTAAAMVDRINSGDSRVVSLDVPTGRNATTGAEPGPAVDPARVVTLALPKTGLAELDCPVWLADIAIPAVVYDRLEIPSDSPFEGRYWVELVESDG